MSDTRIVTDAEIEAALAEARAHPAAIPSLDDAPEPAVVPVPVEVPQFRPLRPAAEPPAAVPVPAPVVASADPPARRRRSWFRRLWRTRQSSPQIPQTEPAAAPETPAARPRRRAGACLALLEWVLDAVNRPFAWLSPTARSAVGLAGLVTLILSVAAPWVMPLLCPPHDAVTWLRHKRQATEARLAAPPAQAAEEPAGSNGGGDAAAPSGHAAPPKAGGGH